MLDHPHPTQTCDSKLLNDRYFVDVDFHLVHVWAKDASTSSGSVTECKYCLLVWDLYQCTPRVGPGHPLPLFLHFPIFCSFSFSPFLFLFALSTFLFFNPFPFYPNSPTPFPDQRSQEAAEPGFSFLGWLCYYLYFLVKMHACFLLYLV